MPCRKLQKFVAFNLRQVYALCDGIDIFPGLFVVVTGCGVIVLKICFRGSGGGRYGEFTGVENCLDCPGSGYDPCVGSSGPGTAGAELENSMGKASAGIDLTRGLFFKIMPSCK